MAAKTRQKRNKTFLPGILALISAVALMLVLMISLGATRPEPVNETTAAPTTLESNPYGTEDFGYVDGYLTCLTGQSILGIDVSQFQQDIDWEQVKAAGVEFVMIRIGYRGSMEGNLYVDDKALEYYEQARAAGLKIGGYYFSQAITVQEAIAEAEFAMAVIDDWELDMPLVYDWEFMTENSRTADMDPRTLTDCTNAFCQTVAREGYQPMVYFNLSQAEHMLYLEELIQYPFWLANYSDQLDFPYAIEMWQYTSEGTVPGIETAVDINLWLPRE